MTIFKHELRRGRVPLIIWSAAVSLMMALCICIYPDMAQQMEDVSAIFSQMGSLSSAFGMDKLNYGEFIGFFGIECGNILGLGGALFAALMGTGALAKEEGGHTAEFLLTHPISRVRVVAEKLGALAVQLVLFNMVVIAVTALSVAAIGEDAPFKTFALLFLAHFLLQLEVAAITFGISALLSRNNPGVGLGLAAVFYFLNLAANLAGSVEFLKFLTPFSYTESADIISAGALPGEYLAVGGAFTLLGVAAAFVVYSRKDIS